MPHKKRASCRGSPRARGWANESSRSPIGSTPRAPRARRARWAGARRRAARCDPSASDNHCNARREPGAARRNARPGRWSDSPRSSTRRSTCWMRSVSWDSRRAKRAESSATRLSGSGVLSGPRVKRCARPTPPARRARALRPPRAHAPHAPAAARAAPRAPLGQTTATGGRVWRRRATQPETAPAPPRTGRRPPRRAAMAAADNPRKKAWSAARPRAARGK